MGSFLSAHTGARSVGEDLALRFAQKGWKTIETSHQPNRALRLSDMLFSAFVHRNIYQAAYVEVYSGMAFLWAELVVRLLSKLHKPILLALHGGRLFEFAEKYPARFLNLLSRANAVVTPSLFLQKSLQPYYRDILYIPNAVEVDHYPFRLRRSVTPRVVWLRALHPLYQPELAIQAIMILRREFENIHLTMIGPDKWDGSLQSIQRLIQENHLQSNVEIVGAVPKQKVPDWLAKGDIFLNTTRYESFGISVLEAALVGLPIVTTAVGELPYLWEDGNTAMFTPVNNPGSIADAVRSILTEPELAGRLSANARYKAEQFDWSMILQQWEKLFDAIAKVKD